MNNKFLKMAFAGLVLGVSSFANAGLIAGTDIVINPRSVSYQDFTVSTDNSQVFFTLTGLPDGTSNNADTGIHFYLFEGIFGAFGRTLAFDNARGQNKMWNGLLDMGSYTFAIGINFLQEVEARTGNASTPRDQSTKYSFTLDVQDVPEPSTVAIFALGIMGLASRRFKKQS
jgi:hypothetical protein